MSLTDREIHQSESYRSLLSLSHHGSSWIIFHSRDMDYLECSISALFRNCDILNCCCDSQNLALFSTTKSSSFFSSMTQIGPISPLLCPRKTPVIALSCHLSTTPMKYTNWVEFKINVMELFIHNPGNVPSGVLGDVDSFVTMYNMLRTKREWRFAAQIMTLSSLFISVISSTLNSSRTNTMICGRSTNSSSGWSWKRRPTWHPRNVSCRSVYLS